MEFGIGREDIWSISCWVYGQTNEPVRSVCSYNWHQRRFRALNFYVHNLVFYFSFDCGEKRDISLEIICFY